MRDSLTRSSAWRYLIIGGLVILGFKAIARRGAAPAPAAATPRPARVWPQRAQRFYELLIVLAPQWREFRDAWMQGQAAVREESPRLREAREVLGVKPGATRDEINFAYRERMRRYHPDQGGPTEMASRINAARDALLAAT